MPIKRVNPGLKKRDFQETNDWTNNILDEIKSKSHSSPVFRVTNYESEILSSMKVKRDLEDMLHDYRDILQPGFTTMIEKVLKESSNYD